MCYMKCQNVVQQCITTITDLHYSVNIASWCNALHGVGAFVCCLQGNVCLVCSTYLRMINLLFYCVLLLFNVGIECIALWNLLVVFSIVFICCCE